MVMWTLRWIHHPTSLDSSLSYTDPFYMARDTCGYTYIAARSACAFLSSSSHQADVLCSPMSLASAAAAVCMRCEDAVRSLLKPPRRRSFNVYSEALQAAAGRQAHSRTTRRPACCAAKLLPSAVVIRPRRLLCSSRTPR